MAQLHNREHYIIGEKEREAGRKSACVVYRAIDAFYLPSKRGSDTRKKKDAEGGGKKEAPPAEWPVKIAGSAAAAMPNNQIRPYFPGP